MAELRLPSQVKTGPSVLPLNFPAPGFRTNNYYDWCLSLDKQDYDDAFDCGDLPRLSSTDLPYINMPPQGRRFREIGSILVSSGTFDGVTVTPVLTFLIPVGYDGIITMLVCNVQGQSTGFVEGSGVISWRLSANGRYLRDSGNLQYSLGSLLTPSADVGTGLRVFSGNIVEFGVTFSTGAGVLNPTANILCACYGWIYPR